MLFRSESHSVARRVVYGHLRGIACGHPPADPLQLSAEYQAEGAQLVRDRLALAGIRLAAVLRAALAAP